MRSQDEKPVRAGKEMPAQAEQALTAERRQLLIAEAAYFRAERRGFQDGDPVADWLEAEAEINARICSASGSASVASKQGLEQKLASQLRACDKKCDELKVLAEKATRSLKHEVELQLKALLAKKAVANEVLQRLRSRGDADWEDLKGSVEEAWGEMRQAIDSAVGRLRAKGRASGKGSTRKAIKR